MTPVAQVEQHLMYRANRLMKRYEVGVPNFRVRLASRLSWKAVFGRHRVCREKVALSESTHFAFKWVINPSRSILRRSVTSNITLRLICPPVLRPIVSNKQWDADAPVKIFSGIAPPLYGPDPGIRQHLDTSGAGKTVRDINRQHLAVAVHPTEIICMRCDPADIFYRR